MPMNGLLPGTCTSGSIDGGGQSWPLGNFSQPLPSIPRMPPNAAQAAAADSARVANLLLQHQRHAALGGLSAAQPCSGSCVSADGSIGNHNHASQGDLQQVLEHISTLSCMSGATVDGFGAGTGGAAADAGAGYHAAHLMSSKRQAMAALSHQDHTAAQHCLTAAMGDSLQPAMPRQLRLQQQLWLPACLHQTAMVPMPCTVTDIAALCHALPPGLCRP